MIGWLPDVHWGWTAFGAVLLMVMVEAIYKAWRSPNEWSE
jgi:hypothetical protein